jgi:hypothetical protein
VEEVLQATIAIQEVEVLVDIGVLYQVNLQEVVHQQKVLIRYLKLHTL